MEKTTEKMVQSNISFTRQLHADLHAIAKVQKKSLAEVVREACTFHVENYQHKEKYYAPMELEPAQDNGLPKAEQSDTVNKPSLLQRAKVFLHGNTNS